MKLMIITPHTTRNSEVLTVNRLLGAGVERLHLRKPDFSESDYRAYLKDIEDQYLSRIVIHDCFHLFEEFSLGGIHLNSSARMDETIKASIMSIEPKYMSTSFHSWQEIRDNDFTYRYVFISPVFDSISKEGYKATIKLTEAASTKEWCMKNKQYCPEIIALGGVGPSNLSILEKNGFDGAAMLGAIWQADDPVHEFRQALHVVTTPTSD